MPHHTYPDPQRALRQLALHRPVTDVVVSTVVDTGAPADETVPAQRKRIPFGSYIDPELQKELRVACAVDGIEIRDALDEALRLWLARSRAQ